MAIVQNIENETLNHYISSAKTIKNLFSDDVSITISDCEKIILHLDSNHFKFDVPSGHIIEPDEPMAKVMKNNKEETFLIPQEVLGVAINTRIVPIRDENDQVIGTIAVATNLHNQYKLRHVAEQFSASSEEISASTEELSVAATDLSTYMEKLKESQEDMTKQFDNTTKILEMINSVAKNTRILGFNAGIEAARSGEYGRGFSVVAKEITKLADQSAESVKEIRQLLDGLKDKVRDVASIIKESVDIAENQSSSIEEISKNLQHLAQVLEDIEELAKKL
ncbi:methyl-accepting chemotaxis protein [Ureibacillus sp. MALMAid1270]|uniref:methyl-accepting chemotaxis protein n=1 Tax=Ureibacillus sp. MALMAid1270 TaxID=3411629 RepID=UPI003BA7A047